MSGNDCWNMYVFSLWQKLVKGEDDWISGGRLFQRMDAVTGNELRPTVDGQPGCFWRVATGVGVPSHLQWWGITGMDPAIFQGGGRVRESVGQCTPRSWSTILNWGRWNRETWQDGTRSNSTIEQRGPWLYDCALSGALSCFIKRRRTVDGIYKTTQWWPRKRKTRHWAIDQSISVSLFNWAPKRWLHKQPT